MANTLLELIVAIAIASTPILLAILRRRRRTRAGRTASGGESRSGRGRGIFGRRRAGRQGGRPSSEPREAERAADRDTQDAQGRGKRPAPKILESLAALFTRRSDSDQRGGQEGDERVPPGVESFAPPRPDYPRPERRRAGGPDERDWRTEAAEKETAKPHRADPLERLNAYPPLQRGILLKEILGPPKGLE
ncbi:MAG: hypothetical protein ACLFP6_05265 [Spirochaetaceae bacterium]